MDTKKDQPTLDQKVIAEGNKKFLEELNQLQEKHGRVVVAILNKTDFGIFPKVIVLPKDQYNSILKNLGVTAN